MEKRSRKIMIIEMLLRKCDFLTSKYIAEKLGVSSKTIIRTIHQINSESSAGPIIFSEKGRGYRLDYKKYGKLRLNYSKLGNYSPVERRNEVLLKLLFKSPNPISIRYLFSQYFLSEAVVSSDIKLISSKLKNIGLEVIRSNKKIKIVGNEIVIRHQIYNILSKMMGWSNVWSWKSLPDLNRYDLKFITKQIKLIEDQLKSTMPYPYNVNLLSHIYILINRYRQNFSSSSYRNSDIIDDEDKKSELENPELFKIAERIVENLENHLGSIVDPIEKYYILQYLLSSRLLSNRQKKDVSHYSKQVLGITDCLILNMGKALKIEINSLQLRGELVEHIKPLLNRLKNNIRIENSLLSDIKTEYSEVYRASRQVMKDVFEGFGFASISDSEIGFLVLYFVKYLEQHPKKIRVLIMCSSGIGTSELLKVKVQKRFSQLKIVDVVSWKQYKLSKEEFDQQIDFIITSVVPKLEVKTKPVVLVNVMFTDSDYERVLKIVKEMEKGEIFKKF